MRHTAIAVAITAAFASAQAHDYVVLSAVAEGDPFDAAARVLADHHKAPIVRFATDELPAVQQALTAARPRNVAIVLRPEQLDFAFARRFLQLATEIDDDPFVDFAFGYITGPTAEHASALAKAGTGRQPKRPERVASVGGGVDKSATSRIPHALRRSRLDGTQVWIAGEERFPQTGRDREFLRAQLPKIEGADCVTFIGHGMPHEVHGGPAASDLAGLRLDGAVVLNVACYTGVTANWFEEDWQQGRVRGKRVEPEQSFCLALLQTGVVGYTAYLCPRPAGPELDTDLAALLTGSSLGDARRRDYDKTVLGYLGFGHDRLQLDTPGDGDQLAPGRDAVHDIMLPGATGGVLFGDPATVPFTSNPEDALVGIDVDAVDGGLRLDVEVPGHALFLQCNDPTAQFDGTMAMKVHVRVPLHDQHVTDVVVDSLRVGNARLPSRVLWAIEDDHGGRWLQLKVNFARQQTLRGDLTATVRVLTTGDANLARRRGGEVQRPPAPPADVQVAEVTDAMRERAAARKVPVEALQVAVAATAQALQDGGADSEPRRRLAALRSDGFAAMCVLLEVGHAHAFSWPLLQATWQPGDERLLLALASGEPLPNFATWAVLEGLAVADTPEVRAYLADRLAREDDAGLFMSVAAALAHLGAREHAAAIGGRLLEFRPGWQGVQPHLIASLQELGGAEGVTWLERIALAPECEHWQWALQGLDRLDPAAAARVREQRK